MKIGEMGAVEEGRGAEIIVDGERKILESKFRESAYTPIKKVVGESSSEDFEDMKRRGDKAVEEVVLKKRRVLEWVKGNGGKNK